MPWCWGTLSPPCNATASDAARPHCSLGERENRLRVLSEALDSSLVAEGFWR
jgi:hypothetical protein